MTPVSARSSGPRARICSAARRRFERFGYRRSGMAEIARDAGVAPGTIYRHFDSKEELLLEVIAGRRAEWLAQMRRTLAEEGTPLERLVRLGQASVEFSRRNTVLEAVLDGDTEIISPALLDPLREELLDQQAGVVAEVIREGIGDGSFRRVDPDKAAFVLVLAARALFRQQGHRIEEILPVFAELAAQGLVARRDEEAGRR